MHLCFSAKVLGNINSYTALQNTTDDFSDITNNSLAADEHASWRTASSELRSEVEKYFIEKYNLQLI